MTEKEEKFKEAEVALAAQQEEIARLQAQNQYLTQRVVILRALVNRLQGRAELVLEEEESNEDVAG